MICVEKAIELVIFQRDIIFFMMKRIKGVGRRTEFLDGLRKIRRYWELNEGAEARESGKDNLSYEHKEEMQIIFQSPRTC